jgi:phenylacetate-CoA ligase
MGDHFDGNHFDDLETRDPAQRETALFEAVRAQIAHARANTDYYAEALASIDPAAITDRDALAALPVTRKSDLIALQQRTPPFGGLLAVAPGALARIYQSPGPIYDADGHGEDSWRLGRAMYAAGLRPGDIIHNTFSYHLTPAGRMVESGAHAIGAAVVPAGIGQTELQVRAIEHLRPRGYGGTPSFLKVLFDKGREMGADTSSLTLGLVGGEPLPSSLRRLLSDDYGVEVLQSYGTADLGLIAYESPALDGMILDEGALLEIVEPGTGNMVPLGKVGEVVVTTFSKDYPLIRFATGDLSAVLPGPSPCGRTNMRINGWMGRADQTAKVKGMFVHPGQIHEVARRHPEITKARLVIDRAGNVDAMTLHCEAATDDPDFAGKVAETVQAVCRVRGTVELVAAGSLASDGKIIEDRRTFD